MYSERRSAVVLDPYPLWLDALGQLLGWTGIQVVGRALAPAEALRQVDRRRASLLVGEIHGFGAAPEGAELVSRAREGHPELQVVVVSATAEPDAIAAARAAGAGLYLLKSAPGDELMRALRGVGAQDAALRDGNRPERPARASATTADLTKRELEILRLVAEGHSNAQLARMLWVTEQTVKFHLSNIYRKLDVTNRTEASRWAQVHDLLPSQAGGRAATVH